MFIWPIRCNEKFPLELMSEKSVNLVHNIAWSNNVKSVFYSENFITGSLCDGLLCISEADLDLEINTTDSTFVDEEYNWGILFLSPLILFGVAGNLLVCMAVSMEKRLQSVTNYFLLSLAITDLLVCVVVMPFSIINEFIGE